MLTTFHDISLLSVSGGKCCPLLQGGGGANYLQKMCKVVKKSKKKHFSNCVHRSQLKMHGSWSLIIQIIKPNNKMFVYLYVSVYVAEVSLLLPTYKFCLCFAHNLHQYHFGLHFFKCPLLQKQVLSFKVVCLTCSHTS